jgi:soluble lytic murein transglycosylase-like protein
MKKRRSSLKQFFSKITFGILVLFILIYNPISARIMTIITAKTHDLDTELFYRLIAAESSFRALSYSRKQAIGLGQVQDKTAQYIYPQYIKGMLWFPPTNLHIAALYFRYLLNRYNQNTSLALAAYNWGESNVDRKLRDEGIIIDPEYNYHSLFENIPETYHFLPKVIE